MQDKQLKSTFYLLGQRRFLPLFCTQFLGAFNDCVFRNALIILLAFTAKEALFNQDTLINLCAAIFVIPYFLFSAIAGQLADKYEKSQLIRFFKGAEVFFSLLTIVGFFLNSIVLLFISLFLLGTQATFFGPIKYSILPQQLSESELLPGNGLIEMGTFIAILLGTICGGILIAIPNTGFIWVSFTMGIAALIGLVTSLFIPTAHSCAPNLKLNWDPFTQTINIIKLAYQDRSVFYSIIGISWFWLYGSMFLTQIPNYTKLVLGGNEHVVTLLLATFSVGIGIGSILCNKLSNGKIDIGIVPLGAIGLTLFAADMAFANGSLPDRTPGTIDFLTTGHNWRVPLDTALMGLFGGFYLVPLYALMQNRTQAEYRSRVVAANNILNAIFMTAASGIAILVLNLKFTIPQLFLLTAILNALTTLFIFKQVPEFRTRFLAWLPW